jgi:hypothetical protein
MKYTPIDEFYGVNLNWSEAKSKIGVAKSTERSLGKPET